MLQFFDEADSNDFTPFDAEEGQRVQLSFAKMSFDSKMPRLDLM
jgi:hypothetical protein